VTKITAAQSNMERDALMPNPKWSMGAASMVKITAREYQRRVGRFAARDP
jgi:hypothetical protein